MSRQLASDFKISILEHPILFFFHIMLFIVLQRSREIETTVTIRIAFAPVGLFHPLRQVIVVAMDVYRIVVSHEMHGVVGRVDLAVTKLVDLALALRCYGT